MRKGMRHGILVALMLGMVGATSASAQILPKNNLNLQDNIRSIAAIDEALFNKIVNDIIAVYKPLAALHGGNLSSNNMWTDSTVNASAEESSWSNDWIVNMYGGLARRPEVTPDGFALVVCHELGHHFGGYAYYGASDWAAAEGQADYYATQVCARNIWKNEKDTNASFRTTVPATVKSSCDKAWANPADQDICYRTAAGGQSLANLLAALGTQGVPNVDTPDTSKVTETATGHPKGQCRLDTYFAGALCPAAFDLKIIPGRNHASGQVSKDAENEAGKYSCMGTLATRVSGECPRCWFAPLN